MSDSATVLATFFGDAKYPCTWKDEEEKSLFWFYDDLHCPNPISPLYFDVGGWWGPTCEYMYRRFGAPIGSEWIAKKIGGYVYSAVVPPKTDPDKIAGLFSYYTKVMPVYAEQFWDRWQNEYIPELQKIHKTILDFDYEHKTIAEALIHMEDALDAQQRAFQIHWIINLAQFQASSNFAATYEKIIGNGDGVGKINISRKDRNWDSLKALWEMKEYICSVPALKTLFGKEVGEIKAEVARTEGGEKLLKMIEDYKNEYGFKAMYTHEYIFTTWYEDQTPVYEALKGYVANGYDYNSDYDACIKAQDEAIAEFYAKISDPKVLEEAKAALETCVRMAPLTPDHHFYIDQGVYSRMRLMFKGIGEMFVKAGILEDSEDIFMLEYEEIRCAGLGDYPVKELVKQRRAEMEAAAKVHPRDWYGTATQWSVYEEPYKGLWGYPQKFEAEQEELKTKAEISKTVLKGIPGYPGVYEGTARFIRDPKELDNVKKGEVLVCKMTNPAWVVCFSQIGALVTDTGGALSHPAVVSREFGIPCVVGTRRATQLIKTGDKVRVDGNTGTVEVIG